jgi:capsular polysaccharide transport system ATP-binding protein
MIDEVIMVGDQNFQRKCRTELFEKRGERALILASHNEDIIREYCSHAFVLHQGKGRVFNDIEVALKLYEQL